ncbi:unnamed protein product [Lactuca virosa]|uniref:Uncharacterized protein n=1 Tax=Lactuca virosa TaxID=75947 RepID=A0AAU9N8S9_9ASTR|nr:unnamed protein product [Lactuca virosa]
MPIHRIKVGGIGSKSRLLLHSRIIGQFWHYPLPIQDMAGRNRHTWTTKEDANHKDALGFHDKPFPQFDNLCKIFGKDRATGHGATDLGEVVTEETQRNSPVDVEVLEEIVKET